MLETRELMATINVADFGAKANDGADDRAAILSAINSSHAGDTILFSGGTFNLSSEVLVASDRTYLGQNGATLKGVGEHGNILAVKGDNVTFKGLTFSGGGVFLDKNGGGKNNNILFDYNVFNLNVTGGDHRSAITFTSGLSNSKITNNYFTGYNSSFGLYGYTYSNLTIANNEFVNIEAGMHIDAFAGSNSGNLLVEQNYIRGVKGMGMEFQGQANGDIFQDNWYEHPAFETIPGSANGNTMAYSLILDGSSNTIIRRNTAIMPLKVSGNDYVRITFEVGGDNTLVEDNYSNGGNHVLAMNDGKDSASVTVRNNRFLNFAQNIGISFPAANRTMTSTNNGANVTLSSAMMARIAANDTPGIGSKRYDGSVSTNGPTTPTTTDSDPAPAPTVSTPTAPTGLLAMATGATSVNLFWSDKSSNESGYKVERSTDGTTWTQIATLGANAAGYSVTGLTAGQKYSFRVCAYNDGGKSAYTNTSSATPAAFDASQGAYVSDLQLNNVTNGWGQLEKDMSNGEQAAGDGHALTLGSQKYAKGLGVHANSEVHISLGGNYGHFLSDIGLDEEATGNGAVTFEVWADGVQLYSSGVMTAATATKSIDVDVTGKQELVLKVVAAADNTNYDHADWANARLTAPSSTPAPDPTPVDPTPTNPTTPAEDSTDDSDSSVYLSDLKAKSAKNAWGPMELDHSNGEMKANDGKTITLNGVTYAKGLGVHAPSDVRYALDGKYRTFTADIGLDDEADTRGSVSFQVWADGVILYDSGKMSSSTPTKTINVNVQGRKELRLVVTTGGDNNKSDHADWADARLSLAQSDVTYLSDTTTVSQTNGWGPAELDSSNGEMNGGDGHTITLAGVTYKKGLGVHSTSRLIYNLGGLFSNFSTDMGIDDEVGNRGSVIFQIWADGSLLFDSGTMTGASDTKSASVDVRGKSQLWLVVNDAGDGITNDHADWANARLS